MLTAIFVLLVTICVLLAIQFGLAIVAYREFRLARRKHEKDDVGENWLTPASTWGKEMYPAPWPGKNGPEVKHFEGTAQEDKKAQDAERRNLEGLKSIMEYDLETAKKAASRDGGELE